MAESFKPESVDSKETVDFGKIEYTEEMQRGCKVNLNVQGKELTVYCDHALSTPDSATDIPQVREIYDGTIEIPLESDLGQAVIKILQKNWRKWAEQYKAELDEFEKDKQDIDQ